MRPWHNYRKQSQRKWHSFDISYQHHSAHIQPHVDTQAWANIQHAHEQTVHTHPRCSHTDPSITSGTMERCYPWMLGYVPQYCEQQAWANVYEQTKQIRPIAVYASVAEIIMEPPHPWMLRYNPQHLVQHIVCPYEWGPTNRAGDLHLSTAAWPAVSIQ